MACLDSSSTPTVTARRFSRRHRPWRSPQHLVVLWAIYSAGSPRDAIAVTGAQFRWLGIRVPFEKDPSLDSAVAGAIDEAVNEWNLALSAAILGSGKGKFWISHSRQPDFCVLPGVRPACQWLWPGAACRRSRCHRVAIKVGSCTRWLTQWACGMNRVGSIATAMSR